jgi:hypothetical protein
LFIFIVNIAYFSSKGIEMLRLIASSNIKINFISNKNAFRKSINLFQKDMKKNVSRKKKFRKKFIFKASPPKRQSKKLKSKEKNDLTNKKINGRSKNKFDLNPFSNSKTNLVKESAYSNKDSNQKKL